MTTPFNINATKDDLKASQTWWRALSINQSKALRDKYNPNFGMNMLHKYQVHRYWENEGKPQPQELIAVA